MVLINPKGCYMALLRINSNGFRRILRGLTAFVSTRHTHSSWLFYKATLWILFFRLRRRMKVGMTSSRYGLYKLGNRFATMRITTVRCASILTKCSLSTDRFLQFEGVKKESPVIANQTSRGEQVLGFCTNRPSRSGSGFAIRVADGMLSVFWASVRGSDTWVGSRLERSRNKVVARERVAGTLTLLIRRIFVVHKSY